MKSRNIFQSILLLLIFSMLTVSCSKYGYISGMRYNKGYKGNLYLISTNLSTPKEGLQVDNFNKLNDALPNNLIDTLKKCNNIFNTILSHDNSDTIIYTNNISASLNPIIIRKNINHSDIQNRNIYKKIIKNFSSILNNPKIVKKLQQQKSKNLNKLKTNQSIKDIIPFFSIGCTALGVLSLLITAFLDSIILLILPFIFSVLAIVFGIIGLKGTRRNYAIMGIVFGILLLLAAYLAWLSISTTSNPLLQNLI